MLSHAGWQGFQQLAVAVRAAAQALANHVCQEAALAFLTRHAAGLPRLTARLLERGLSESDVEKILGANFLRVFEQIRSARR